MKETTTLFPAGPYTYSRDKDRCDDVWNIYAPTEDRPLISILIREDEPLSSKRAETIARLFATTPLLTHALLDACFLLGLVFGPGYEEIRTVQDMLTTLSAALGVVKLPTETENEVAMVDRLPDVQEALDNALAHFLPAQKADFEALDDATARKQHIFNDLQVLNFLLRRLCGKTYL